MKKNVLDSQEATVLCYIASYKKANPFSPSFRDIAVALKDRYGKPVSSSVVGRVLKNLIGKGYVGALMTGKVVQPRTVYLTKKGRVELPACQKQVKIAPVKPLTIMDR